MTSSSSTSRPSTCSWTRSPAGVSRRCDRAIDGLKCTTAVHICYGYGIKANIDWKNSLGEEWRQYEKIFPGAGQKPYRPGLAGVHQLARAAEAAVAAGRQGLAGRRDRCRQRQDRDARAGGGGHRQRDRSIAPKERSSPAPIAAWRRCGATSPRRSSRCWELAPHLRGKNTGKLGC